MRTTFRARYEAVHKNTQCSTHFQRPGRGMEMEMSTFFLGYPVCIHHLFYYNNLPDNYIAPAAPGKFILEFRFSNKKLFMDGRVSIIL